MYSHDTPETAPVRRRIIPQPLRTEPACALITADTAQIAELEARLKRDRPLIIFPSISHFWAEPARREPWAAIVIARACAWDPRFDSYVRRRRSIALFAVSEEVYSWPETVARLRDLTELSAWLEALNAPEPAAAKEAAKRERREKAKAALNELSASWLKQSGRTVVAPGESREDVSPAASTGAVAVNDASAPVSAAPAKQKAKTRARPVQLDLASVGLQSAPSPTGKRARVDTKRESLAPRKKRSTPVRPPELLAGRSAQQEPAPPAREQRALRHKDDTRTNSTAQREFMRLAAELGLARAGELLAELRKRATRLGLSP
jgi:hypothetical protein